MVDRIANVILTVGEEGATVKLVITDPDGNVIHEPDVKQFVPGNEVILRWQFSGTYGYSWHGGKFDE